MSNHICHTQTAQCLCVQNNVTAKILCHKEDNEGKKELEECNSHHPTRGRFPSALTWGYCRQYLHRGRPARVRLPSDRIYLLSVLMFTALFMHDLMK